MKKIITLITLVFLLNSCGNTELPVVNEDLTNLEITGKVCEKDNEVDGTKCEGNYIWGAAMNFAWNELKENILKENIILDTKNKESLELNDKLNNSIITKNILDEKSYYIKSGYGQETVNLINKESKNKFPKKSFGDLDIELKEKDIISYAYFYKAIEYKEPFEEKTVNFKGKQYKGFEADIDKQRQNVKILNYENDDKFMIKLNLKDNSDELILVKGYDMNSPKKAIVAIDKYNKENLKTLEYNDTYHDFFEAPNIKLDYNRNYKIMIRKRLLNKVLIEQCKKDNLPDNCYEITKMFENIKFDMDNRGAKVENDAVIIGSKMTSINFEEPKYTVRNFYLNKDYWIIMKRKSSNIPYFVLGIKDGNLMEK